MPIIVPLTGVDGAPFGNEVWEALANVGIQLENRADAPLMSPPDPGSAGKSLRRPLDTDEVTAFLQHCLFRSGRKPRVSHLPKSVVSKGLSPQRRHQQLRVRLLPTTWANNGPNLLTARARAQGRHEQSHRVSFSPKTNARWRLTPLTLPQSLLRELK